jgi:hypothetical protein
MKIIRPLVMTLVMTGRLVNSYDCYNQKCGGRYAYSDTYISCNQSYQHCYNTGSGYPLCRRGSSGTGTFCLGGYSICSFDIDTGKAHCDFGHVTTGPSTSPPRLEFSLVRTLLKYLLYCALVAFVVMAGAAWCRKRRIAAVQAPRSVPEPRHVADPLSLRTTGLNFQPVTVGLTPQPPAYSEVTAPSAPPEDCQGQSGVSQQPEGFGDQPPSYEEVIAGTAPSAPPER